MKAHNLNRPGPVHCHNGESFWLLSRVLEVKRDSNGVWMGHVRWHGWPGDDTWESVSNLVADGVDLEEFRHVLPAKFYQ